MKKYSSYINLNKRCYNTIAVDYESRYKAGLVAKHLVRIIDNALKKYIRKENYRILELGCGTGNIFAGFMELPDKNIYQLYGIDFSKNMIKYAEGKRTNANIKNKNVLNITNVSSLPFVEKDKFDMVIMVALIHLFPKKDAKRLLANVKNILNPNGLIYIDTTEEKQFVDGEITEKQGYSEPIRRLRTKWTEESFEEFLNECGFDIIPEFSDNHKTKDGAEKVWLQRIINLTFPQ
ncbi:MAG: class I SAM-dependent methyltransferase [Bacteroidales bacterium]|jgi:ubiquinone/menaquinone biosynthesis C-methylase UbiE|nr:class I SAM-dependent methyltransferase [Bacteroidales bacterium]